MKILVVTQCFYPDNYAINNIVSQLVKRNHSVTVLTGLPDYTTSQIPKEYKWGKRRHENYNGADVYRTAVIARHHGVVWRCINYISFIVTGCCFARFHKFNDFDIVYVWQASPVTMALPGIVLKKRYSKPLYLYCLDLWPESVKAMGLREGNIIYYLLLQLSNYIYRNCDHISVSSRSFFKYLENTNKYPHSNMDYLPQYASKSFINRDFCKIKDNCFDFLFIGNIGKATRLDYLINAIAYMKNSKNIKFHIVGGGSDLERIKKLARDNGVEEYLVFYGPKSFDEACEFYKFADACVITLDGTNHIGDTLPGKLQTYMAVGKPIFGSLNGDGNMIINESGSGKCVPAGDSKGLADVLIDFITYPDKYKECGINARKYFLENFMEEKHFNDLEANLNRLIKT